MIRKKISIMTVGILLFFGVLAKPSFALTLSVDQLIPEALVQYMIPRFALKTRIRFERVESGGDLQLSSDPNLMGVPIFTLKPNRTVMLVTTRGDQDQKQFEIFRDWLQSGPGRSALSDFRQNGLQVAYPVEAPEEAPIKFVIVGNPVLGEKISKLQCQRCHKVNRANKYSGVGNAPSFHAMRAFDDWYIRFSTFYAANPHKALISVTGSGIEKDRDMIAIAPIDMEIEDINHIVAFVHSLTPLDLGKPIQLNP